MVVTSSSFSFSFLVGSYHRFHFPVDAKIISQTPISGEYFTVSPMAVRADVDVFTKNKRHLTIAESPEFGRVAFVAVGATMVGRCVLTRGKEISAVNFNFNILLFSCSFFIF